MLQVAAALLFALSAALGIMVIWAMLKSNENAILSALLGEGAFPIGTAPEPDATPRIVLLRQPVRHRAPARSQSTLAPQFSRAA